MLRTLLGAVFFVLLLAPAPAAACAPPSVPFASGSHRLDREALAYIDELAAAWRARPSQNMVLTARADRVGPADYNMRLSRRRGEAVRAAFVRRGVPASVIRIEALGESTAQAVPDAYDRTVVIQLVAGSDCGG